MPVKFSISSKNTVGNLGIALFSFALDCHAGELSKLPNHFAFSFKICCWWCCCRSIRVHIRADAIFRRERENGVTMHVPAYFGTRPQDVNEVCDIDIGEITRELSAQVEHWNSRGSGFIIVRVKKFRNLYHKISSSTRFLRPVINRAEVLSRKISQCGISVALE